MRILSSLMLARVALAQNSTTLITSTTTTPLSTSTPVTTDPRCDAFYSVVLYDNCYGIQSKFSNFTIEDFYAWNPIINNACTNLYPGQSVCIGIPGYIAPGPQPQLPGTVVPCKKYELVEQNASCWAIEQEYKISHEDFVKWNPAVGQNCGGLWTGYQVCVGV